MKRLTEAAATILEHARLYLAALPLDQQDFTRDERTGWFVNKAVPILFNAECAVRLEGSQE